MRRNASPSNHPNWYGDGEPGTREQWRKRAVEFENSLREVYDYMCEVEGAHMGCCVVRSYESLPRTAEEREAIGERARRLLGIGEEDGMRSEGLSDEDLA